MRWLQRLATRRRIYDDLSEEIRLHLEEHVQSLMADGLGRKEAEHQARKSFGNVSLLEERSRETWQWPLLEHLFSDIRFAFRNLVKAPVFSVTVVLTIALGVGANAAIFNLMRAVVFPSLHVTGQEQLYQLRSISTPNDAAWLYSKPAFERLRAATAATAPVAAHTSIASCSVTERNGTIELASMQLVSTNFFTVLGLVPMHGRFLIDGDSQPAGGSWAAVLRYGYWQEHYASDPSIIGRTIAINGTEVTIVGIAPERFTGIIPGDIPDFWLPTEAQKDVQYHVPFDSLGAGSGVSLSAPYHNQDQLFWLTLIARVAQASEVSSTAAWTQAFQPDLALYARFTSKDKREAVMASQFSLHRLAQSEGTLFGQYARPLTILMALVAAVLCIACINLASLQSTRLLARERELALRTALGASRLRILCQLWIESFLLTSIGGISALLLAGASCPILLRWASQGTGTIPLDLHFNTGIYCFTLSLLIIVASAFGILPAWRALRSSFSLAGSRASNIAPPQQRILSNLMLSSQIALSLLLLVLTSMFLRTLRNLNHVDTGFDRQHILTVRFSFHRAGYKEERLRALAPQLIERMQSLPGVHAAALDMCPPPGCLWNGAIHLAGHPELSEDAMQAHQDDIGSGYFRTLGMPVIRGREFSDNDRQHTQQVAIVNQSLARKLFGDSDPLGQRVGYGAPPNDTQFIIVGVVGDARVDDLRSQPPPIFYRPLMQESVNSYALQLRTSGDPVALANLVHASLLSLDPHLPVTRIDSLDAAYDRTLDTEHLLVRLTSIFGALALMLAAFGLYGVLSFRVARSVRELGVRMALGASRVHIVQFVLAQAATIFLLGAIPGMLLAVFAGRAVHGLLFGINGTDWPSLIFSVVLLSATVFIAAFLPARRAAWVDPVQSLRTE